MTVGGRTDAGALHVSGRMGAIGKVCSSSVAVPKQSGSSDSFRMSDCRKINTKVTKKEKKYEDEE